MNLRLAGLPLCLLLAECGGAVDDSLKTIEHAIEMLDRNSKEWQGTLKTLEDDLVRQGKSTLANEVQSLVNRSIATGGVEMRCDADFLAKRMQMGLRRILAAAKHQPIPPAEPGFCQVDPTEVRVSQLKQNLTSLNYYGYDMFDRSATDSQMRVILVGRDGQERDFSHNLSLPTHYLMAVRLAGAGVDLNTVDKIAIRWNSRTLSTVNIIHETPPVLVNFLHVVFHTNDDDKHADTYVSVSIPGTAEWHQTDFELFADNSDAIKVLSPHSVPLAGLTGREMEVCIAPVGHDTWRFNVSLNGNRSDGGARYIFAANSLQLSESDRCRKLLLP